MDVENGITKLSQTAYIESMLKRFDVTTTAFTPAATDADLGPKRDDEPAVDKPVREAIGCLMWTKLTRPDIALPLNKLQKIAHSPTGRIWNALVRIMSYLNFTKDFGITYVRGSGLDLSVFVDASYADNEVDRRSTTGLAGVKEALFVRGVLSFIAPETSGAKIKVLEDNKGALALIENPFSSARSKHIDVRFHFIRELFKSGKITAEYVPTGEQHADMLTKVLGREKHRIRLRVVSSLGGNLSSSLAHPSPLSPVPVTIGDINMTIDYIEPVDPRRLAQAKTFADGALFSDWEAVACPVDPATGLRELDLSRVVCMADSRTCEGLRQFDLPGLFSGMISDQTTPGKRDLLLGVMGTEMQAGKEAAKSPAEIPLQTKRALLDATAKYLFTCPSHAGMMHTDDLVILPVFILDPPAPSSAPAPARRTGEEDETRSQVAFSVVSSTNVRGQWSQSRTSPLSFRRSRKKDSSSRRRQATKRQQIRNC
ncbi:unnamed protein product [Ectocarpus sp. CCAP 1310/34]|nr:unnamed protein product [Ectocarpus sp. CCAP 1310/34]